MCRYKQHPSMCSILVEQSSWPCTWYPPRKKVYPKNINHSININWILLNVVTRKKNCLKKNSHWIVLNRFQISSQQTCWGVRREILQDTEDILASRAQESDSCVHCGVDNWIVCDIFHPREPLVTVAVPGKVILTQ